MEGPSGFFPAEPRLAVHRRMFLAPQNPRGEDPVEERLDEGGTEEVLPLFPLELQAESFLQRFTDREEGGKINVFDAGFRVPGVGSQKPGHVFRRTQGGRVQHHPREILDEALTAFLGGLSRMGSLRPKRLFGLRKPQGLQFDRIPRGIFPDQHEIPVIRYRDKPVFPPILRNLLSGSGDPRIVRCGFYLDDAPLRHLARDRLGPSTLLELVRREESAIRIPNPAVR